MTDLTTDLVRAGADDYIVDAVRTLVENGDARWMTYGFDGEAVLMDNHCESALLVTFDYGKDFAMTDHGTETFA